jgi:hypothetical protein
MGPNKIIVCVLLCLFPVAVLRATDGPMSTILAPSNPLELQAIPFMWAKTTCTSGIMGCYSLEQLKLLKQYDIDLTLKLNECSACRQTLMDMQSIQKTQTDLLRLSAEREQEWKLLAGRRTADYTNVLDDLAVCEDRPTLLTHLPWIIAGAVVLVAGAFVAGMYTGKKL